MNSINIGLCKELWDNFDKWGWEAQLTEPSTTSVCSQPIAAHTEGGKRWAQHGAGAEPGWREYRGRGSVEQGRYSGVRQTPQKIKSKICFVRYEWGEEKRSKMQFGKSRLERLEKHHLKHT